MKRIFLLLLVVVFALSFVGCNLVKKEFNITADELVKEMDERITLLEDGAEIPVVFAICMSDKSEVSVDLDGFGKCNMTKYKLNDVIYFSLFSNPKNGKVVRLLYECTPEIATDKESQIMFDWCSGISIALFVDSAKLPPEEKQPSNKELTKEEMDTMDSKAFETIDLEDTLNIENIEKDSYTTAKTKKAVFEYTVKDGYTKFDVYPA